MTESGSGDGSGGKKCAWCGRRFEVPERAVGRPRRYCRRSCRQRDFEARRRATELGLAETDLVVARTELSRLDDMLYVLACAVDDTDRDLADAGDGEDVRRALDWLLEAARPLAEVSRQGLTLGR